MRYLSSILLFCISLTLSAQKADTVKKNYRPTGVRAGIDLVSLILSPVSDEFQGWEGSVDIDFYRYFLVLEAGSWSRDILTEMDVYSNRGNYWRAGVDMNFLNKDPEKNMFFLGFRYANSTFDEQLTNTPTDPVFGVGTNTFTSSGVHASWGELTTGLRVKMWKFFWMGYTIRYKFGLNTNETSGLTPYDVPGYGRTDKNTTWGFSYYMMFRIPLKKEF
ncbi:MAG: hypothetical protein JNK44_04285 [Cyclobacteriaceae bacterium]|nr:hypothetical protein [Cyclobacteriaceae bacterium]